MVMILSIMGVAILSIMLMVMNKYHDKDADGTDSTRTATPRTPPATRSP